MSIFTILPFILFLVVIGTAIAERTNIPYPLILVVAGLIAGFIPGVPNWHPPQDVVLTLFLPPILFAAARLIAWDEIKSNLFEIFSLSVVLVIVKTIVIAFIISWLIPQMAFPAALVLGAIISPTDSIAATTILNKMNTKKHLVRTLEIESLFNDAVSITLYGVAVLFVFGGAIYLNAVTYDTILGSLGGIVVGLVLAYVTGFIIQTFLRDSVNDLPIIMSLILAYVAYIFATHIQVSGVLAVVAAGLYHRHTERTIRARIRLTERSAWNTYLFFLNGLIFTIIGLQLPFYLSKVSYLPISQLILFPFVTILLITLLRFIWVLATEYCSIKINQLFKKSTVKHEFSWSDILISSWSGMRGMVSLTLALALPLQLSADTPFPNRHLIIFLTIVTILFTLLVQGLTLPYLVKWLKVEKSDESAMQQTDKVMRYLTKQAMDFVANARDAQLEFSDVVKRLVENYYGSRLLQVRLAKETKIESYKLNKQAEKLLIASLEHERKVLHEMLRRGEISEEVFARVLRKLDRDEVGFSTYK